MSSLFFLHTITPKHTHLFSIFSVPRQILVLGLFCLQFFSVKVYKNSRKVSLIGILQCRTFFCLAFARPHSSRADDSWSCRLINSRCKMTFSFMEENLDSLSSSCSSSHANSTALARWNKTIMSDFRHSIIWRLLLLLLPSFSFVFPAHRQLLVDLFCSESPTCTSCALVSLTVPWTALTVCCCTYLVFLS